MKACEFEGLILEYCSEVLDAMYFTSVLGSVVLQSSPVPDPAGPGQLAFCLSFVGDISGRFGVQLEPATARNLIANFLGTAEEDLTPIEISEGVGELANMLCGSVMSRVEGEETFALSHPEPGAIEPAPEDDFLVTRLDTENGILTVCVLVEAAVCTQ
jgi:CheY-specific phosphatase CheX